jgi:spermidine/putrescine transport system permease protein
MNVRLHPAMGVLAICTLALLYVPMAAVALFSVNANRRGVTWEGFTLEWYVKMFQRQELITAATNSLVLAVVSTLISTVLGTMLALAIARYPWGRRTRGYFQFMVLTPVVTPDIVFAAALVIAFKVLQQGIGLLQPWGVSGFFHPGLFTMIIAHVTFQVAFVTMVVQSRLATFSRNLEEAGRDLYASSWYLTRRITLPLLAPGIVAGAMLAFTLSLDDFIISFFTSGGDMTLPLRVHADARQGRVAPETNALSTAVFLLTVVLVLGMERLTRKDAK